jgi:hypothetical protein
MLIQVTQEDIDLGVKCSCSKCPVARAIHRETSEFVAAGLTVVIIGKSRPVQLPDEVEEFIQAFDEGQLVTPFSFELNV